MHRALTLCLATSLLLCGCGPERASAVAQDERLTVRRGAFEDRFLLSGQLRALRSQALTTPHTPNWMIAIRWLAPEGSVVKAGEPVVQFDTASTLAELKDKRLTVSSEASQLERTGLQLEAQRRDKQLELLRLRVARDKAKLDAEVPEALQASRDFQEKQLALARAESSLRKAQTDLDAFEKDAASQLAVLRIQLEKAERDVERGEAAMERLILKAPVDGVLVHGSHPWEGRKWQVGDNCWPGTVVADVPDLSAMEVEASLNDVDDGKIAPGLRVRCRLDTYPERLFEGRIRSISGVAQAPDRTSSRRYFSVQIEMDRSDPSILRPGMSVKIEVLRRSLGGVLLVPRQAVDRSGDKPRLRVRGQGPVEVALTACDATDCALESGPPEGTTLEAWR